MLKKISIAVAVLLVSLLAYAATKPDTFRVERSTNIIASPEKIFPHINDLKSWGAWSPWEKMDPAMKKTPGGAPSGKGAAYEWDGNTQVGKGRMEITESSPPSKITIKLDFMKPFEAHNTAEFGLERKGDSTHVTWAMFGPQPYMAKIMSLFMDCDKMVGRQFEEGLANLKTIAEKA